MSRSTLALALLLGLNTTVFAHAPLTSTSPLDKAELDTAPALINLTFAKSARITKVTLTHINGEVNQTDRLELPTKKFTKVFDLKPQFSGAGTYKVNWRALGEDGHVLKGGFEFTVSGD